MLSYEESIVIRRAVEEVFEYMQDIRREHEWQPNLREATQTPEGEPGVGAERRYVNQFMGKRIENVYVYTQYEPNRKVAYKSSGTSDTQAAGEVIWEAMEEEKTRVTMRMEVKLPGMFGLVPKSVIVSFARKELGETLTRLKGLLERT